MGKYLRLQASMFGDFREIDFAKENVKNIYSMLLSEGLLPTLVKEFDASVQNMRNRPNFVSENDVFSIVIGSERIDVICQPQNQSGVFEKKEFLKKAMHYFEIMYENLEFKANRLSFIIDEVLKELDGASQGMQTAFRYLKSDRIYNNEKLFEWSANSVTEDVWNLDQRQEIINLNVTVAQRLLNGIRDNKLVQTNALVAIQDLNTKIENRNMRFIDKDMEQFLEMACGKSDEILQLIIGE